MKKVFIYILLSLHLFFSTNIWVFLWPVWESVHAATNTWWLDTPANYSISDTTKIRIRDSEADIIQQIIHAGAVADNSSWALLLRPRRVSISWDYAYISAHDDDAIQIIDVSDPVNPIVEWNIVNNNGTIRLDRPYDSVINGDYLYVAAFQSDAIQIIDISDPSTPIAAGNFVNNGTVRLNGARGLAIQWDYLYVASYADDAVQVFDISIPTTLTAVDNLRAANGRLNGARDIIVDGDYAYVSARNDDSIQVIDISDPSNISFAGEIIDDSATVFIDSLWGLEKSWDYLYTGWYNDDGIQIIDVSIPTAPSAVSFTNNTELTNLNGPRDVKIDGDYLYIADLIGDSIMSMDITNPLDTFKEFELPNSGTTFLNGVRDIQVVGDYIYVVSNADNDFVILEKFYDTTSPTIIPTTAFNYGTDDLTGFSNTLGAGNAGTVSYQISRDNGTTWYYYNGTVWLPTINWVIDSNSASVIDTNITTFNSVGAGNDFLWKAFLTSDGAQKVELDSVTIDTGIPIPPSPGWVDTNLNLWLKADAGTSTTTDGAALTGWDDQSGNWLDATAIVSPDYRSNTTDSLNFNPVVDFNGTNDYMSNVANGADSDSYYLVIVPDVDVEGTSSQGVPFGFDCLSGTLSSGTCGLPFWWMALGAFTTTIPDEVITHAIGSSANWRSAKTAVVTYPADKPMLISVNDNAAASTTNIYEKWEQVDNTTRNTYQTLANADYSLGRSPDNTYPFYYDGKIAEVINYDWGLTTTQRQKIESYLALKYGMTLNSGTQNYTASDGTTLMWSTSTAGTYIHNIFGIWRDDDQELWQVQSKSVEDDAIITLEALWEGTNITNSFTDIADKEFLTISHNNGGNTWTDIWLTGYYTLQRQWRVQETGDTGTVSLDFDVGDTDFNVPATSTGTTYYAVYDSDDDNDLSDETPTAMINISAEIWRLSGINPADDREFTIATEASTNNIPTDITLSNSTLAENEVAGTTVGTLTSTDADTGDTHSYSFVSGAGDDDNTRFSITGNTLAISHSPDYEIQNSYSLRIQTDDGNGGQYQEVFPITITDLWEAVTSLLDLEDIEDEDKYEVSSGDWSRTTTNPFEGSFSLESDNLWLPNTQSCFEINHTFSATWAVDFHYNVSSQAGGDFLRFYIDDVEQGAGWSGTVPWTQYTSSDITPGNYEYKWCYIKNNATNTGTDNAFVDLIRFQNVSGDIIPPIISSLNYGSGTLLPGGNHDIIITYSDDDSGIDVSSDDIELYKWDGSSWGSDIATTWLSLGSKTITTTTATYPTNSLDFGKYRYDFIISDNDGNTSTSSWAVFYIDEPEFIIGSSSIDIGNVNSFWNNFSDSITITVKTIGAAFDVTMDRSSLFEYTPETIPSWDGSLGYGYDLSPYTSNISAIGTNQLIATQVQNINTNGNKNTYTYGIKIGALVDIDQATWDYEWFLDFWIDFTY